MVDDNMANRMVAGELCRRFGADVIHASDGEEALTLCKSDRFDLVLMDLWMPVMDGVEASKAIRSLPRPDNEVPIIAITADVNLAVEQAHLAGFCYVLEKPISAAALFTAITTGLERLCEDQRRTSRPVILAR